MLLMRKMSLLITALAFSSIAGGLATSSATNCDSTTDAKPRTAHDPYGSCETKEGQVKCGKTNATKIGPLGYLIVDANKGAQVCSEDADTTPISGRITVYKHSNNKVTVAADGGDKKNSGGAAAWDRVDVDPNNGKVCVWRGGTGTYWTSSGGTSTADAPTNQCTS